MAKRRGNPNWGKPRPSGPVTPTVTEFEQVVREYKLSPDQYLRSTRLREWARRNKNSKYIPEPLLEAWGFEIESTSNGIDLNRIGRVAGSRSPFCVFAHCQLSLGCCHHDFDSPSSHYQELPGNELAAFWLLSVLLRD